MLEFRTDIAIERRDIYKEANKIKGKIDGIESNENNIDGHKVTTVNVLNEEGEKIIDKRKGIYTTIDVDYLSLLDDEKHKSISKILNSELKKMLKDVEHLKNVLVVGLGNTNVTPDALGPMVTQNINVNRHLIKYAPNLTKNDSISISAIAPGVLGTTGIETQEILEGILSAVKMDAVIVIDSLCSRSIERIATTIQVTNTGIVPGAGVNNRRKELTINTLKVPVIAIGVPTVVDVASIANDSISLFLQNLENKNNITEYLLKLKNKDNYNMIKNDLIPREYNYIVTPKEIDDLILNMSKIISEGINMLLN